MKTTRLLPLLALCINFLDAEEHTVEQTSFTIQETITATVLPENGSIPLPSRPMRWTAFSIEEIKEHGERVAKGDLLIRYRATDLDDALDDNRRSIAEKSLALEAAEQELSRLTEDTEFQLSQLKHTAQVAKEEHEYFTKTRCDLDAQAADQQLERAKQYLANEQEELRQLEKMYEADEVTEETEEIILTRQRYAVTAAQFTVKEATIQNQRTHEVTLPREAVTLAQNDQKAKIALEEGQQQLPRAIEQKRNEINAFKEDLKRAQRALSELEKDRTQIEIKAPADGWFFHGIIENGRWTKNDASKSLAPGMTPPVNQPYSTFIPLTSPLALFAQTDGKTAQCLQGAQKGEARFHGREDITIPVTIQSVSEVPAIDGSHMVTIQAQWKKGDRPAIGTNAEVRCISYHREKAIQVPTKALSFGPDGFSVMVKLADGKIARRTLEAGRVSGEFTEVRSGIEAGQVIVIP